MTANFLSLVPKYYGGVMVARSKRQTRLTLHAHSMRCGVHRVCEPAESYCLGQVPEDAAVTAAEGDSLPKGERLSGLYVEQAT